MKGLKSEPDKTVINFTTKYWSKTILKWIVIPVFGIAMLLSCKKNNVEVVNTFYQADTLPAQTVIDLETVYTDSGKVKWVVVAPLLERFSGEEKNKTYFPKGMKVDFYDGKGNINSWISSKYAIYHEDENLWEASDSVVAVNDKGEILNTELLFWDGNEKIIYSPKFVKITTKKEVIYGDGFEADQSFEYWIITKVKGTIYHDSEK